MHLDHSEEFVLGILKMNREWWKCHWFMVNSRKQFNLKDKDVKGHMLLGSFHIK